MKYVSANKVASHWYLHTDASYFKHAQIGTVAEPVTPPSPSSPGYTILPLCHCLFRFGTICHNFSLFDWVDPLIQTRFV